jgi:hypothetical protein
MVPFLLFSYWALSEWERLKKHPVLAALLIGYFVFLATVDIAIVFGLEGYSDYSMVVIFLKSLLGCALLVGLIHFSASRPALSSLDAGLPKD